MSSKQDARKEIEKTPAKTLKPGEKKSRKDKIKELVDEIQSEYGFEVEPKKDTAYRFLTVQNYLNDNYEFRFNLFTKLIEYRKRTKDSSEAFRVLEERDESNLRIELAYDAKIKISKDDFRLLVTSKYISNEYEPVLEYLYGLPKWDGKDRFPEFLQRIQLKDEENRPLLNKLFKKWFVTMIAALVNYKVKNETFLIFTGLEGRGKTRFFESLIPDELKLDYSYEGGFDFHRDKDHKEMLGTKILIINDELAIFNRTDQELLKTVLSRLYIEVRRAYDRRPIKLWRKASFCGTTNDLTFLTDQGANRRYLPFHIHYIDLSQEFDVTLLYAQALAEYKNGFNLWYNLDDIAKLSAYNEQFRRKPPEEEMIMLNYQIPEKIDIEMSNGLRFLTSTDIMYELASMEKYKKMNTNDSVARRIGKTMGNLGFLQKKVWLPKYKQSRDAWIVQNVGIGFEDNVKKGESPNEFGDGSIF